LLMLVPIVAPMGSCAQCLERTATGARSYLAQPAKRDRVGCKLIIASVRGPVKSTNTFLGRCLEETNLGLFGP